MNCSYCNEPAELTLSLERTVREFNRTEQTVLDLPVCKTHSRLIRKLGADCVWKNKLFNSVKLNSYLEYLLSAEETLEKKPKMQEKIQKTLEELK